MLHSMTGYGRGEATSRDVTVVVELKSVNNRFRDLHVRCPKDYMALEPRVVEMLKAPFSRGRIDAFVRRSVRGGAQHLHANQELATEYATVINDLTANMAGFVDRNVPIEFILQQEGVLEIREAPVDVSVEWEIVEVALQSAIADLASMRQKEGQAMEKDLRDLLLTLRSCVDDVEKVADGVNERLQSRLLKRLKRLVGDNYDPYRVSQEVALLADKADVNEELTRLRSHCDQFLEALTSTEPVGRRLDFLLQEMNREVNTIGSKAVEHPVSQRVVDMKTTLERMRELAANVE